MVKKKKIIWQLDVHFKLRRYNCIWFGSEFIAHLDACYLILMDIPKQHILAHSWWNQAFSGTLTSSFSSIFISSPLSFCRFQTFWSIQIFTLRRTQMLLCSSLRTRPRLVSVCCQCVYPKCREEKWQHRRLTLQGGSYQTITGAWVITLPRARRNLLSWVMFCNVKENLLKEEHVPQWSVTIHCVSLGSRPVFKALAPVSFQASQLCQLCFHPQVVSCRVTRRLRKPPSQAGSFSV